ncbi:MAG: universal stress protein [Gammaproteobacteria bacterium]|nr:MAG: universal stress protein [Gammaproteobacteria bacterium]
MGDETAHAPRRRVLVPVDGSANSDRVIEYLIREHRDGTPAELVLLNVQMPLDSGHARMFVSPEAIQDWHREEGEKALQSARARLDAAGIPYAWHVTVGRIAETIVRFASEQGCDGIVMGTHGRGGLTHLLLGSVASAVSRDAPVPVTLIK